MIPEEVVRRYATKYSFSLKKSADLHKELELFLDKASEGLKLSPSNILDDVWHEFILDTTRYIKFCQHKYNKFIHHIPTDQGCDSCMSCSSEIASCETGEDSDKKDCSPGISTQIPNV